MAGYPATHPVIDAGLAAEIAAERAALEAILFDEIEHAGRTADPPPASVFNVLRANTEAVRILAMMAPSLAH